MNWERVHHLKTWPLFFDAVMDGTKTFELRKADRDFKVNDILRLEEYSPGPASYTGRWITDQGQSVVMAIEKTGQGRDGLLTGGEYCTRCGESLKPGTEKWMSFDGTAGIYMPEGELVPTDHIDQGQFPFGCGCMSAQLAQQAREDGLR